MHRVALFFFAVGTAVEFEQNLEAQNISVIVVC
jgi:hypothetical protein